MWRGTRSFFCILPKESYLRQTEGAGSLAACAPLPSSSSSATFLRSPNMVGMMYTPASPATLEIISIRSGSPLSKAASSSS